MLSNKLTKENIIPFINEIFDKRGSEEFLGENVTIAEHMLQAATLAEKKGYSETIIVAALLHDIGHFTSEFGSFEMNDKIDRFHEDAGAKILEKFFILLIIHVNFLVSHVLILEFFLTDRKSLTSQQIKKMISEFEKSKIGIIINNPICLY
mgnify:CR=1 FL=1